MVTDRPPRDTTLYAEFMESDRLGTFQLPADDRVQIRAESIEAAMQSESTRAARQACVDFLTATADFYQVPKPSVKVLLARPLHVREDGWGSELFGDYQLETVLIRIWMRTAVRTNITKG